MKRGLEVVLVLLAIVLVTWPVTVIAFVWEFAVVGWWAGQCAADAWVKRAAETVKREKDETTC
jgi:hypothetical protein